MNNRNDKDMKDSVKQRRQQKIKELLERHSATTETENSYAPISLPISESLESGRPQHEEFIYELEREELDPEAAWKKNPNPWAGWSENKSFGDKRSYVKGPDLPFDRDPSHHKKHTFRRELQWKFAVALLIFAVVWAMFRYDNEWTLGGQAVVKGALKDEINFAAAAAWYKETFAGAPSFIPIFQNESQNAVGADGTVKLPLVTPLENASLIRTFAELLNGVELAGESEQHVSAVETGRVLVVTSQDKEGSTVVIQHANKRVSIYGLLGKTEVKVNDWVESGDEIGSLLASEGTQPSLLYFAVKQNDIYIDPVGVIPID